MAKETTAIDPVSHLPQDGQWHPAEVEPNVWQGRRSWVDGMCTNAVNDVEGEEAVLFDGQADCQARCDDLNAQLDAEAE